MATHTTIGSGLWSASGTWDANGVPVDNGTVVIAAGHTVDFDVDQSGWTNGIAGLTITGSNGTPATLRVDSTTLAAGTYHLKMKSGTNPAGSTGAVSNHGRLLANSDGVWGNTGELAFDRKFIIDLQGTSVLDATHLDIRLYCKTPANPYVRTYKTKYRVTGSAADDTLNKASHGLTNGTAVMIMVAAGGSLPAPLIADRLYWVVNAATDSFKLAEASGGTAIDLTTAGSGDIDVYDGHTDTGTATMNVLNDVTGDACWVTTAGHNTVVLVDAGPAACDIQFLALNTINAGTIVLSANVDSTQYPGARIWLSSRNISIRSAGTTTTQNIISASSGGYFGAEIVNTSSTVTSRYGYGLGSTSVFCTIPSGGVMAKVMRGLSQDYNCTIYGAILGADAALIGGGNNNIYGVVAGCNYCVSDSYFNFFSPGSSIRGCNIALASGNKNQIQGEVMGCNYVMYGGLDNYCQGAVHGCTYHCRVTAVYQLNYFRNADTFSPFSIYGRNTNYFNCCRQYCENHNRVDGTHRIYDNFGDIIKTACTGSGDAPSQDPDGGNGNCIEASSLQSGLGGANLLLILDDLRIWMTAAAHTVTFKVQTTYSSGITAGNLKLTANYIGANGVRTEATNAPAISQRSSAADWSHTLAVTFTPAVAGWVDFTIELRQYSANDEVYVWPAPVVT